MTTVAILGAGAWGTALAIHLAGRATAHPTVTLWTRDERHARAMAATRVNTRYLPGIVLLGVLILLWRFRNAWGRSWFFALAYFVLPADAIPDLLPMLGYTDDALVLVTALRMVSGHIRDEHREAARQTLARGLADAA